MLPWAVTLLVWFAATPARASDVPCVRLAQQGQAQLLAQGLAKSATFAHVAGAVCRTDVIVYVELSLTMPSRLAGTCQLVVSTPSNRFLRIYLNSRVLNGGEMISVLAHELEHAGEIGRAPWVREPADVARLQGMLTPGRTHSQEADRVGLQVLREVLDGPRAWPTPGQRLAGRAADELACGRAGEGPCTGSSEDAKLWKGLEASNLQGRTSVVLR